MAQDPLPRHEGRISGPRLNRITEIMLKRYEEWVEFYVQLLTEDGYPPFTVPLSPREQYQRLNAWRLAGDPRFWEDAEAQAALAELAQQFGPPPPLTPPAGLQPQQPV